MKVAYLGPAGTFSEDAVRTASTGRDVDLVATTTVYDAISAVADGSCDLALVPFENSIEGSVRPTLDALAFDVDGVTIAGEHDQPIRHSLIARERMPLERVERVLSHPQVLAQCARFLREQLAGADAVATPSSAEAIRAVGSSTESWAAIDLGSPPTGSPLTINASVAPVLGERITTNNHATYDVTFQ